MRALKLVSLLATTFSVVLSSSVPSSDELCRGGTLRCNYNAIEECNASSQYKMISLCSKYEGCIIDNTTDPPHGECRSNLPDQDACYTVGLQRCNADNTIEECNARHRWVLKDDCGPGSKCTTKNNHASCVPGSSPLLSTLYAQPTKRAEDKIPKLDYCQNIDEQRCRKFLAFGLVQRCRDHQWLNQDVCYKKPYICDEHDGQASCRSENTAWTKRSESSTELEHCQNNGEERCHKFQAFMMRQKCQDNQWTFQQLCQEPSPICVIHAGHAECRRKYPPRSERSENIPSGESCDNIGEERCGILLGARTVQKCSEGHQWYVVKVCPDYQPICVESHGSAACRSRYPPPKRSGDISSRESCDTIDAESCSTLGGAQTVVKCGIDHRWHIVKLCPDYTPICVESNGVAGCRSKYPPPKRSEAIPAPEMCGIVNSHRCLTVDGKDYVQNCGTHHQWVVEKECPSLTPTCVEGGGHASCSGEEPTPSPVLSRGYIPPPPASNHSSVAAPPIPTPLSPEPCTPGVQTCDSSYYTLLKCGDDKLFQTELKCLTPDDCKIDTPTTAHCKRGGTPPPKPKVRSVQPEEPCTPGTQICDLSFYSLLKCGDDQLFHTELKCATPGDCKIDSPTTAHCEQGGLPPPKANVKRSVNTQPTCKPSSTTCSTTRQHLFKCSGDGKWVLYEQCAYDGACKMSATTHQAVCTKDLPPSFNEGCEETQFRACEMGVYEYCKTESNKTPADCQEIMCGYEDVSSLPSSHVVEIEG